MLVKGSFTAYFDSSTIHGLSASKTSTSPVMVLTNGSAANADFCSVVLPRLDLTDSDRDDAETGQERTYPYTFTCEYNAAGGAGTAPEQTTIAVQDSLAS